MNCNVSYVWGGGVGRDFWIFTEFSAVYVYEPHAGSMIWGSILNKNHVYAVVRSLVSGQKAV